MGYYLAYNWVMIQINIHEAKTHFSKYLAKVARGETIVVCKHNKPFVEISPIHKAKLKKRVLGLAKGSVEIAADCFEPWPKDYLDQFYSDGKNAKDDPLFWKS